MDQQNAKFEGWAKVELLGRVELWGYVTTLYFGNVAVLQVDIPGSEEREEVLRGGEFIGNEWVPGGTKVKREAIPHASPMVNPGSLYRMTPCSEEVAKEALSHRSSRAYAVVSLPEGYRKQIGAPDAAVEDEDDVDDGDEDATSGYTDQVL